jgi:acyl dehydratase
MASFSGTQDFKGRVGEHLGYSDWLEVTQERVNQFAEATGDFQWIHVDVERAKAGPFGGPIAHGYLTLSMAPTLMKDIFQVSNVSMAVNYGLNKVRFPSPVPVGSKLRVGAQLANVEDVGGGIQATMDLTFEVQGSDKPACVAQIVFRYYD